MKGRKKSIYDVFIALFTVLTMTFVTAVSVSAHAGDYFSGTYSTSTFSQNPLRLRIDSSAITSLLTYGDVYVKGTEWNGFSSKANVEVVVGGSGGNYNSVVGSYWTDGTLGLTVPQDASNNTVSANSNWHHVIIRINSSASALQNNKTYAKMNFLHEVGHALKLSHPISNSSLSGHNADGGYPYAVMNQGVPNSSYPGVAPTLQVHDKLNLIAKWGG